MEGGLRALIGVALLMSAMSIACAADCGNNGFCPLPTATRGDIIYHPERDQRPSEEYDYGETAKMVTCNLDGPRTGLRITPETCIRIGGFATFQFLSDTREWSFGGPKFQQTRIGYDGEFELRIEAISQTELGTFASVFRHVEQNFYSPLAYNEFYLRLGGVTIGQTSSLWEGTGPSEIANYSTFTWFGRRFDESNMRDVLAYAAKTGPYGFGLSVESVYSYDGFSDPGLVALASFGTSWGGTWLKAAYDTEAQKLSMKAGIHWDIVAGKAAARLLAFWTEGRSHYIMHYLAPSDEATHLGIIGAYEHFLTDSVSASASVGVFGGRSPTAFASELSLVWQPSSDGEFRLEATYYRDTKYDNTGIFGGLRFTRFF